MSAKKIETIDMTNSIDFYNFCSMDNDLPVLEVLNERFCRLFRVTLSNHLRMITDVTHSSQRMKFGEWAM